MGKAHSVLCRRKAKNKKLQKVIESRLEELEDLQLSLQQIPNLQSKTRNFFSPSTNAHHFDYRQCLNGSYLGLQELNAEFRQVQEAGVNLFNNMESIRQKIARKISEIDELIGIIGKIENNDEEGHQELQQFEKKVSCRELCVDDEMTPLCSNGNLRDID